MSNKNACTARAIAIGFVTGGAIAAAVTCLAKPKKSPMRRRMEHWLDTAAAVIESVLNLIG